jgi:hypothetical protein
MKGNLTIEAAYLFPFCFFVLGLICYLGIFLYNQAVLELTGYECILQTIEERELRDELLKEHLYQRAKENAQERTFGVQELQVTLKVTTSKIAINYKGRQSVVGVPINVDVVYGRTNPERALKMINGIGGETYEGIFEKGNK